MTSDEKTFVPSLLRNIKSDLYALGNISTSVKLSLDEEKRVDDILNSHSWEAIISYLPLEFYHLIESYSDIYDIEKFDLKYARNPKRYAYDKYGTTNMWRPIMILNRCPTITRFNFQVIRCYNIEKFSSILAVLMARCQSS